MTKENKTTAKKEEKIMWEGGKAPDFYKHPQFGHVYGPTVSTPSGRFAWVSHLVKPKDGMKQQDGSQGPPRYEITLLLSKDDPRVKSFINETEKLSKYLVQHYNVGKKAQLAGVEFLKDGDEFDLEKYPFYKDMWVLIARNQKQPPCYDKDKLELAHNKVLGGQIGKILATPLITAHGMSFKLEAVQVLKDDGVRFAGGMRDLTELLDDATSEDTEKNGSSESEGVSESSQETGKAAALNLL